LGSFFVLKTLVKNITSFCHHAFLLDKFWYLHTTSFRNNLLSPPKIMPTYLKHNKSVRGGVTLPIPPTQKYLPIRKRKYAADTTAAVASTTGSPLPPSTPLRLHPHQPIAGVRQWIAIVVIVVVDYNHQPADQHQKVRLLTSSMTRV
jgi:hypothetical protein